MSNNKEILLGTKLGWTYTFAANDAFPIEANKIFSTLTDATNYVKSNPTAYAGNVISVIYDDTVENNGVYFVKSVGANGELVKVGSDTSKEKVFIMPEDFFGEMYDEPDENSFVGKIKQEYVTDILENRYTKMLVIDDNSNPQVGEFDYSDEYILKFKIRIEDFSQGLIFEQIQIFEINVNRDSVDFCKVKLQGFNSYFPFTYSMFDEDPQNSDGVKRLTFINSVLSDGENLPEENKQFFKKNMGSFADWNAQEGEVGYIENKPFYSKGDIRQIDVNGEYTIVVGEFNIGDRIDISWDLTYFDEIFRGSTSFVIQEDGEGPINYYQENDFYICGGKTFEMYAYSGGDSHYGKVTYIVNGEIKTLEEKYIPDTVIKTTPQELSSTDKNQVKENLGISNPDWNAQEGEAGYIENRTHYLDIIGGETLKDISVASDIYADSKLKSHGYENIDGDTFMKLVYEQSSETFIEDLYIGPELIKAIQGEHIYYNYDTSYQFDYSYSYDSSTDTDIETYTSTIWINVDAMVDRLEDDEVLEYAKEKAKESILVYDETHEQLGKYFIKKVLDDMYLPDTVLKATPQTLSDKDKNQLLDNLGIANLPFSGGESENSAVLKGGNNKVTNANEVALGKYNESNNDTMFSIGIGTSDSDRKNAFEVKGNGDIYFNDIKFELVEDTDDEVNNVWNEIIGTSM